jgi:YesN/AraC family two-component response regulator
MAYTNLLWIDFRQADNDSVVKRLGANFTLATTRHIWQIPVQISKQQPALLIFEYDFPDLPRLKALQQTKNGYPHLPILMLTRQHSEALAVWSFRSGVRDYVVKPVHEADLYDICIRLQSADDQTEKPRKNVLPPPRVPRDVRVHCMPRSTGRLAKALEYLKSHFHEKLSLDAVASLCDLNRFELSRAFSECFGITFRGYLIEYRIKKAIELLENPHIRIIDVACLVGFRDVSYFSRTFRKHIGMAPSEYREWVSGSDAKRTAIPSRLQNLP